MYAFLLVATVMWQGKPVHFYYTSTERFAYEEPCLAKGVIVGDKVLARYRAYKGKPDVKTNVSCSIQITTPTI